MIDKVTYLILKAQNPDGGWGALAGKRSNTEATSLVILGLHSLGDAALDASIDHGLTWLTSRQRADGSWPVTDQLHEGSWMTALATVALTSSQRHQHSAMRGAHWLCQQKGASPGWIASLLYRFLPQKSANQLNPDLQGWFWSAGAFSWVEPTAYALIALQKLRPFLRETGAEARLRQGELLLYDRMCAGGGWNYGNAQVLGEELRPYPDITALTLIALQNHQVAEANTLSLHALRSMTAQVPSGLALSWSILAFALYGYEHEVSLGKKLLMSHYEATGFLGEIKSLALALLACEEGAQTFRV